MCLESYVGDAAAMQQRGRRCAGDFEVPSHPTTEITEVPGGTRGLDEADATELTCRAE